MSSINQKDNNNNIKTAVDIFSEILVQIIDALEMGNADTSSVKIININKQKNYEERIKKNNNTDEGK